MRRRDLSHFSARTLETFERGPLAAGVRIKAAAGAAPAEILVYDFIGADWFGDGVTAKGVISALAEAGDSPVVVRVNSPGGDVFEGLAIYNALRAHAAGVEVVVDGLAASAASIIAMAGSKVTMNEGTMFMIHNAWTLVAGDRNDMTAQAAILGKIDVQMAGIYAGQSGAPVEDMTAAMDAETWYTADEALAAGLASAVLAAPARPKSETTLIVATVVPPEPPEAVEPDPAAARRARQLRVAIAQIPTGK